MTDNKIFDTILNPNMNIELIPTKEGLLRGVLFKYSCEDKSLEVRETSTNNLGTNYKKGRQLLINEYRKQIKNKGEN